jgi:hypothetical protein
MMERAMIYFALANFAYPHWILIGVITAIMVSLALALGLTGTGTLVAWRLTKLFSMLFGIVGLLCLMLIFTDRVTFGLDSSKNIGMGSALLNEPLAGRALSWAEARFKITEGMIELCRDPVKTRACEEAGLVRDHLLPIIIWDGKVVPMLQLENYDPALRKYVADVNMSLSGVNALANLPSYDYSVLPDLTQAKLFLASVILILVAVAGFVGEAAFQLRQALDERKRFQGRGATYQTP